MPRRRVAGSVPRKRSTWSTWVGPIVVLAGCSGETPMQPTQPEQEAEPSVVAVTVASPVGVLLAADRTFQLEAAPRDADGATVPGVAVDWRTSDTGIATVSGSGLVQTFTAGSVEITASANGVDGDVTFTVADANLDGIAAIVDDPFTDALRGTVAGASQSAVEAALAECRQGSLTGGLTAVQECVAGARAAVTASATPADAPMLAVLAILIDRVELLLSL